MHCGTFITKYIGSSRPFGEEISIQMKLSFCSLFCFAGLKGSIANSAVKLKLI